MDFIKYSYSALHEKKEPLRLKYIVKKYSANKEIQGSEFIRLINDAYYKFVADIYNPRYESTQCTLYTEFFKNIPPGLDIVDVGAGTGASFRIIKDIDYKFGKYYFIEPSKYMAEQFRAYVSDKEPNLEIFVGPLDKALMDVSKPKVFIMSAVLRTIVYLDEFLADLKEKMRPQDFLFLPVEPNNEAFSKGAVSNLISAVHAKTFGTLNRYILGIRNRLMRMLRGIKRIPEIGHLEKSLHYLVDNKIVTPDFSTQHLYALIYYHNYLLWRSLEIPTSSNEGFFTPDEIQSALDAKVIKFENLHFFQFQSSGYISEAIESVFNKIFPKSGATVSYLYRKS
jgi:SAM-dependent methyltransferase